MSAFALRLKHAGMNLGPLSNLFQRRKREHSAEEASTRAHFDAVVRSVGPQTLAAGLIAAFRSGQTPLFSELVAQMYANGSRLDKEFTLKHLGRPADQGNRTSPDAVRRIAEELELLDVLLIERFSTACSERPGMLETLDAPVLEVVLAKIAERYK